MNMIKNSTPLADGFHMPGEFEPHMGCLMIWPERPGSWSNGATAARKVFAQIAKKIAESETVYMLVSKTGLASAQMLLPPSVQLIPMETDDAWARDTGATFVIDETGQRRGINWQFNAWGGTYDGLYAEWDKDQKVAEQFCHLLGDACYDATHFVLEGGSIHCDGEGTVLVTESCLLSPGRNPNLSRMEIESNLKQYLGAEKVIWLPRGIYQDETNEHVDNICAFINPGEVVLAWTDNRNDPQYALSLSCLQVLKKSTDAKGRAFRVHKLPIPSKPVCITAEDLKGLFFAPGEDSREEGERLAASYVNFYIANKSVLVPQFGDNQDANAIAILQACFPDREIVPVYARDILIGGGNIHCITQQIPLGKGHEI